MLILKVKGKYPQKYLSLYYIVVNYKKVSTVEDRCFMNITRRNTALLSITALFIALGPIANSGAIPYCVGALLSECVELPNGLQYDISACKKAALLEDNYDFLTFIPIQTCTRLA